ncbi:MAG TPA: carboxypeptidase-like regulatory domain-containing protein [Terriglobia bacterium]|nr:carboxypeptidase-like regulatory domain-containing protein [Terriglobia bacterium]
MRSPERKRTRRPKFAASVAQRFLVAFSAVVALTLISSVRTAAQANEPPKAQLGQIMGTVTDVRGDPVAAATVVLVGLNSGDRKTLLTGQNGFFQFDDVRPGVTCHLAISARGFADWTSPDMDLGPGEVKVLGGISLRLATQSTTVTVTYNSEEVARQQVKAQETQRVFGVIPNFYISYEGNNTAPMTPEMKFQMALRVSYDPVTVAGVALTAGLRQASDTPDYQEGVKGYGERFGAVAADGFSDIMIGGAILPSLLHEDPRYFYQGTGTTRSRLWHAISSPFWSRRDNGSWGPNYSSMGGDVASSALANLYYPESNRGSGLVFSQFGIATAERIAASVAQEFILSKLTHRGGHVEQASGQ